MKTLGRYLFLTMLAYGAVSCGDDEEEKAKAAKGTCVLQSETTGLIGNEAYWEYTYADDGRLVRIEKFNRFGIKGNTIELGYNSAVSSNTDNKVILSTLYDGRLDARPSTAQVSLTIDGVEQRNYKTFFFFYDQKNRLVKIGEQTDYILNDYEWDLHITYNDNDNVTHLLYEMTTGPREGSPPVIVTTYDNNPTPYAGIAGWKFMMSNFAWDNYDPAPILTALSKNNPLDYTSGPENNRFSRTMEYTYNEAGYPVECKNTNKLGESQYTFLQTYAYTCP